MRRFLLLVVLALAGPLDAAAETAYVTDRLVLGVYEQAGGEGRPFRTIESGTELTVIERGERHARVRLPDGETGWVKKAYLVDEQPARAAMPALEARHQELQAEVERLRDETEQLRGEVERRARAAERLDSLTAENERLESKLQAAGIRLPFGALLGLVVGLIIAGFAAGAAWLDYRHRKRHGGFRL